MSDNIPLDEWSGSRATKELQKTIQDFNTKSSKQTNRMLVLTILIAILTFVLVIGLVAQIWTSIRDQSHYNKFLKEVKQLIIDRDLKTESKQETTQ